MRGELPYFRNERRFTAGSMSAEIKTSIQEKPPIIFERKNTIIKIYLPVQIQLFQLYFGWEADNLGVCFTHSVLFSLLAKLQLGNQNGQNTNLVSVSHSLFRFLGKWYNKSRIITVVFNSQNSCISCNPP